MEYSESIDPELEVLEFCLKKVLEPSANKENEIEKYQYLLNAIKYSVADPKAGKGDLQRLQDLGTTILSGQGMPPSNGKFGHLHARLHMTHAKSLLVLSFKEEALWSLGMADHFLNRTDHTFLVNEMAELRADLLYSEGRIKQANVIFESLIESHKEVPFRLRKKQLRCLRLQTSWTRFDYALKNALREYTEADQVQFLNVEEQLSQVVRSGDIKNLAIAMGKGRLFSHWPQVLPAVFNLYSSEQKKRLSLAPKVNTLRKKSYGKEVSPSDKHGLTFLYHLQEAYKGDDAVLQKLVNIEKASAIVPLIANPETRLLAWASLFRWAFRTRQKHLTARFYDSYSNLSNVVSSQSNSDCLNLMVGVDNSLSMETYWVEQIVKKMDSEVDLPVSSGKRNVLLAKIAGKALIKTISVKLGFRPSVLNAATHYEEVFKELVATLGMLKGPVMKIGQHLYTHPGIDEKQKGVLEDIFFNVPPISWQIVEKTIEKELKSSIADAFGSFEKTPLAAASIGQVHRATLKDGREVAVKVLYPKIRDIIRSDLRSFRLLLQPILKRFYKGLDIDSYVKDISALLEKECDYNVEMENQKIFYELFKDDPNVVIPEIIDELSGSNMIVMTYHEGVSLVDFASEGSDEEKQHVFDVLTGLYAKTYFKYGIYQGDIHPFNFLINDGKVTCLDFGFTVRAEEQRVKLWGGVLKSISQGDGDKVIQLMTDFYGKEFESIEGFVRATQDKLSLLFDQINSNDELTVSLDQASDVYQQVIELNMDSRWHAAYKIFSSEDLCGLRLILGMNWLQVSLGVKLRRRDYLEGLLSHFEEDSFKFEELPKTA